MYLSVLWVLLGWRSLFVLLGLQSGGGQGWVEGDTEKEIPEREGTEVEVDYRERDGDGGGEGDGGWMVMTKGLGKGCGCRWER